MGKLDVTRLPVEHIRHRIKAAGDTIACTRSAERRLRAQREIRRLIDELQRRRELLGSEASAIDV